MYRILLIMLLLKSNFAIADGECKINAEAIIGVLEFEITGCKIDGALIYAGNHLSGAFAVDLKGLDTGVNTRNKHMREKYLEVESYPIAAVELKPMPLSAKTFDAVVLLHGKSKEIKGKVLEASPTELKVQFQIDITDYGIEKPGYKGIVVGQILNVFAHVTK